MRSFLYLTTISVDPQAHLKNDDRDIPFVQELGTGKVHVFLQNSNALCIT